MRMYRDEYLKCISELTAGDRKEIIKSTELFIKRGLADHFGISARVKNSDISGYPLLINSALTTSPPLLGEMHAVLHNSVIKLRPELLNNLSTVRLLSEDAVQFLVCNILTARNSKGMKFIECSDPGLNPSFANGQSIERVAQHVSEKMSPLCRELDGVSSPERAALIIHRHGSELSKPDEYGISGAMVVPYLKRENSIGLGGIIDTFI